MKITVEIPNGPDCCPKKVCPFWNRTRYGEQGCNLLRASWVYSGKHKDCPALKQEAK